MGDHGNRFGGISNTAIGELENRNPMFFMSVPERMRQDHQVMDILKRNKRELITHYDIYATMLEIARVSSRNPDLNWLSGRCR